MAFDSYIKISSGLTELVQFARKHPDIIIPKIKAMQDLYLKQNKSLYSDNEKNIISYYQRATGYKFQLANLSLEQLWSLSDRTRSRLFDTLTNSIDILNIDEDEALLASFTLESFLFYATSFLDFYMLYLCLLLRTGHEGKMTQSRFFRELRKDLHSPFKEKAESLRVYFQDHVYGNSQEDFMSRSDWGALLKSLRDKVAHRDKLRPTFNGEETLLGDVLFNWPTIQGETYDRFCQSMQNGIFTMLQDTTPIIFDLEWKPGPYVEGMWE